MDVEIAHLVEAVDRIVKGEDRILKQQKLIEELRTQGRMGGSAFRDGQMVIDVFRATLAGWNAYRGSIEESIARLDQAPPSVDDPSSMSRSGS